MKTLTAVVAALLAAVSTADAQPREKIVDRIQPKKGPAVEGLIVRETFKEVEIQITGGGTTKFAAADIAVVEYGDAPPSFKGALNDIAAGSFAEALGKINNTENDITAKILKVIPRAWFGVWSLYYKGLCQREMGRDDAGRLDAAVLLLNKFIDTHKDARFLPDAFELALGCYGDKGDQAGADALMKKIDAAPVEIRGALKKRAEKQKAEMLLASDKIDEAKAIFQTLSRESDRELAADATEGVIKCLVKAKKPDDLVNYCKQVLAATSNEPALLLVASNALGDSYLERKMAKEAARQYVDSIVRYHPGRGSRLTREHERALYMLGKSYEELAASGKDEAAKKAYTVMAGRTYRELALEYPSGKYRDEASGKAAALDK